MRAIPHHGRVGIGAGRTLVACVLAAIAGTAHAVSGCSNLDGEPVNEQVSFEGQIQPMLDTLCEPCHTNLDFGDLTLRFDVVRAELLGAAPAESGEASAGYPGYFRVKPGVPNQSLFFLRVNCEESGNPPDMIAAMPPGGGAPTDLQALIHDWIASGAIMASGERIFVGSFETIRVATP